VLSAEGERLHVVKFEPMRLRAAMPCRVYVSAALAIALEDGAPDTGRDMSHAPARVRRRRSR